MLAGCGTPLPPDKREYAGTWHHTGMTLAITPEGGVEYERMRGGTKTTISAPIRRFEGDDLVVGLPGISTTFLVQRRPYRDGADWKMVVDGVELTKTQ